MKVPVDEIALMQLKTALNTHVTGQNEHGYTLSGPFTLNMLLKFWSGYDRSKIIPRYDLGPDVDEYVGGPVLTMPALIRALIAEIERLREVLENGTRTEG